MLSLKRNACWDTATARLRDATEMDNDGMIKFVDIHYQTEPNLSFFSKSNLINDDSSF